MLANALLLGAVGLLILVLLDIFLSDAQKTWIDLTTMRTWNLLDSVSRRSVTEWLRPLNRRFIFTAASVAVTGLAMHFLLYRHVNHSLSSPTLLPPIYAGLSFLIIGPVVLHHFVEASSAFSKIVAALAYVVVIVLLATLAYVVSFFIPTDYLENPVLTTGLYVFVFMQTAAVAFLIVFACFLLIVYAARPLLSAAELIVRRLAEYSKGPILALSAILAAIAAVLKAIP